jgi:hypothetical protein
MTDKKIRTWPCSVCRDPTNNDLWNVRKLDSYVTFNPGVIKDIAQQACDAMNDSFDWGRGYEK